MFRTRDFILLFTTIVFLILAIGTTVLSKLSMGDSEAPDIQFTETEDADYVAVVGESDSLSRSEKLAEMRRKIAAQGDVTISAPIEEIPTDTTEDTPKDDQTDSNEPTTAIVQICAGYTRNNTPWSPFGLQTEVSEGARIYFHETIPVINPDSSTSTSSTLMATESYKEVALQLPIRNLPSGRPTCLSTDVVGVAQDGSLIRNNEVGLYNVFGSDTLIGYALDGFPIYGVSAVLGDSCGGSIIEGQYRYLLSDDRETIINCFSAPPVKI